MTRTKEVKLDGLGGETEKVLTKMMREVTASPDEMRKQGIPEDKWPTFMDKLRVLDRVLKWQAIKLKVEDDEGGFFNGLSDDDEPDEPPRGKKGNGNGRAAAKGGE